METSYFFLSLSISRYPDLQRAEREFSRMSDVETVTIGGHEGFGRHLLSNLLSWGRDERNEGKDVDEEKGRRRGMERWRTGTPNGKSLKMRSHLLHVYIYFYYIYIIYTRYMDTLYRGRCVHSWTTFPFYRVYAFLSPFPSHPRFFAMPRLFRERILGCPYKFLVCGSWKRPKISAAHVVTRKTLLNRHHGCG